jgi:toxin ParE1/3/4
VSDLEFRVTTSALADEDIADIFDYISKNQSLERALLVMDTLEGLVASLSSSPMRGARVPEVEIESLGDYRQLISWPFRLICRIVGLSVVVVAILDGRRDVVTLLAKRLTSISTK